MIDTRIIPCQPWSDAITFPIRTYFVTRADVRSQVNSLIKGTTLPSAVSRILRSTSGKHGPYYRFQSQAHLDSFGTEERKAMESRP